MSLAQRLNQLVAEGWKDVFARKASFNRAIEHARSRAQIIGRHTISSCICAIGRSAQDWSADYKLFSRSPWQEDKLFNPVVDEYLRRQPEGLIGLALDDTNLSKTGKKIPGTQWRKDAMSPPFHVNFLYSLRFLQASLLFPHDRKAEVGARAVPIRFRNAPSVKKPGRKATEADWDAYKSEQKRKNLSTQAVELIRNVRSSFDDAGAYNRMLVFGMDGSFCNKTVFKEKFERTILIARIRKDARLCHAALEAHRIYAKERFTPEDIRKNEQIPYRVIKAFYGGCYREVRVKEVINLLWQRGTARQPVRIIVIAPQPYKPTPNSRIRYRQPGFLLTTDLQISLEELVQIYLDRWQIEVNHRDEKTIMHVGDAQVRSPLSVNRHPAFSVAVYSLILLASLCEYGLTRTSDYLPSPKWRKPSARPSLLDMLYLLVYETCSSVQKYSFSLQSRASP